MVEFCLVTHRIGAFIEDSDTDLDRKPDYMRINGSVTLTPKLARGDAVLVTDDEGARTVPVVPITAQIIDGVLVHEGEPGVYVFAGGPNSNPEAIAYTVEYSGLVAGAHSITLRNTSFEAVPGGEVDLAGVAPVAGSAGQGVARGEKGDPGEDAPHLTVVAETTDTAGNTVIEFSDGTTITVSKGDKGDTGLTPTLTAGSATTLAAGAAPTVGITGTKENPVLNIGVPLPARSSRELIYTGTGTPLLSDFPDAQIGDYIVRKSDGQEWKVES